MVAWLKESHPQAGPWGNRTGARKQYLPISSLIFPNPRAWPISQWLMERMTIQLQCLQAALVI